MMAAGHIALIIAFSFAVLTAAGAVIGARAVAGRLKSSVRYGVFIVFGFYTLALILILYAFFTKDFSVKIVAEHASKDLPPLYTLSALYADKSGSMFLWGWLISLFSVLLIRQNGDGKHRVAWYAIGILAVIQAFYLFLVGFNENVFSSSASPVADGFGLNPLLQNLGMLIHPPLLYIGFAAFAVVFALVMAALLAQEPGTWRYSLVKRWTVFAWCTLGIGNLVGMWWSYNELGWGGYWAWDPVENAGLMPWLLGTAFLHSIAMRGQRNYMQWWTMCLIVFTFVFTLMSPFITHGGIESPLHGFYGSPFPPYILGAIIIVIIGSMVLLYKRRHALKHQGKTMSLVSREGIFLLTNIVLVVLVFIIFIGTVLPRVVEALGGTRIAIDRGFFDKTCGPIMLLLVFLMGVCPLFGWGKAVWKSAGRNVIFFIVAVIIVSAVILITGMGNWYIAVVVLCGLPLFIIFREWWRGTAARRRSTGKDVLWAFLSLLNSNRTRLGGFIAHIGIVLIALGIITSSFYALERTETLDIRESMRAGKYELTYNELAFRQDSSKVSADAGLVVYQDGKEITILHPSYAYWFSHDNYYSEAAVRTTAAEDLFVSLVWTGFDPGDRSATFRVLVNPLIVWIWAGGGFFLAGGAVSLTSNNRQTMGNN